MGAARLNNIRSIRRALGKSQSELADLLGVSVRTVQSYEQGRRRTPPHVQELAGLLLNIEWRKEHRKSQPCWKIRNCDLSMRAKCRAYQFRAGDICWLTTGNYCGGQKLKSRRAKLRKCQKCFVMKRWLGYSG